MMAKKACGRLWQQRAMEAKATKQVDADEAQVLAMQWFDSVKPVGYIVNIHLRTRCDVIRCHMI